MNKLNRIVRLFTSGTIVDVTGDTSQSDRTDCVERTTQKQAGTHDDTETLGIVLYVNPRLVQADLTSALLEGIPRHINSCFQIVSAYS